MTVLDKLRTALSDRYRVEREIGVGGMATVYLAHDLRHDRNVAIKVLHPDLAAALGAERFLAEIKTTAKLQHPHILPLLDSGGADGLLYYVMPYVSGESLRNRLERETQLAVDDAVRIARECLSALESAHKQGVVHRDIKPENILMHEDQALVADFGIALAVSAAGGARMTQTGLSLGTPAYMAPEQAMGERVIDGRADIYALGAVLYEMLVGEAPFTGPTVQAIVARVMTESPRPVTGQRRSVPENVNAAVLRALEKLPADRFHSAAEFSSALATPGFATQSAPPGVPAAKRPISESILNHRLLPWAIAGVAMLAAIFFAVTRERDDASTKPTYVSVDLPPDTELPPTDAPEALGLSDDGTTLAFAGVIAGRSQLFVRRLDEDAARPVQGGVANSGSAAFSADGKWLAFSADRKIWKVPVRGGPPTPIATSNWAHLAWIGSNAIVYTKNYDSGLNRVSAEGGDTATLTFPDRKKGELGHWWPQLLPGGDHVLFTNYTTPPDKSKIEVISLGSRKRQTVLEGGYFGRYVDGRLIFVRNQALASVAFDPGSLRLSGTPVSLPLDVEINPPNGWAAFAAAPNGTLAYRTDALKNVVLTWSDENGNEEAAVDSSGRFRDASASPDGKKIAVVRDGDVWVYDRQRSLFSRLTDSEQIERSLTWSPDSREIFYSRDVPQYDIFKRAVDGSRAEELVITSADDKTVTSISPDGRTLLYSTSTSSGEDIYATSPNPSDRGRPTPVITGPGAQMEPKFSPDGSWITYTSDESGRSEVFLAPFPVTRGPSRQQVSVGGGAESHWSPDGRTIYYGWSGRIMKVRVDPRSGDIGRPELLRRIQPVVGWTIAPDGRFLLGRAANNSQRHSIKVVLNWAATLRDAADR
jgi:eukaryotic-like serine/threonine-protein kinase